ncbi:MAG: flagellar hook-associated protein FlgK [bacterium]
MRSTFFGIETMRRAILSQRRVMDTIGHNIANAATPGYSRQRVNLATTSPYAYPGLNSLFGPGQIGTGVIVESIERIRDQFVDKQIRVGTAQQGELEIEKNTLRQVENVFLEPSSTEGLNGALSKFFEAWQELSKRPDNIAVRNNVINTGQGLVNVIHNIDQTLRSIREDLNGQLREDVTEINRLADEIARLNVDISRIFTHGDVPNDLMDKRDLLLDELSKYVDISVEETEVRGLHVRIGSRTLVQDDNVFSVTDEMAWDHPSQITQTPYFRDVSQSDFYMLANFSRGELKGIVDSRDVIIPEVQAKFTELVRSIADEVNNLHVKGFGMKEADLTPITTVLTGAGQQIVSAAPPNNRVRLADTNGISVGDVLRIEDSAAAGAEAVTVTVTAISGDEITFEPLGFDPLQKPDESAGYAALTNYTIAEGAVVRKIDPMKYLFFEMETIAPPQFASDAKPSYFSRMTSSVLLPDEITLNSTIADLENLYGVDITTLAGTTLQLDDYATVTFDDNTTLQRVFSLINAARIGANDGEALQIKLDEHNRRVILSGVTREALDQLGGAGGSVNSLFRVLGFEGHGIDGVSLPVGTTLDSTLASLGVGTGFFMIDNVELYINDPASPPPTGFSISVNQTLRNFISQVNTILNAAGSTSAGTQLMFDPASNRLKIVSSHQFSTRTDIYTDPAGANPQPFNPPLGSSNFLSVFGLQRYADRAQDSTAQNIASVTSSDAGSRLRINADLIADVAKIAASGTYFGIPGDNAAAVAIAELKNVNVLSDIASGNTANPTETLDEFYNNLIAKAGTDSQRAVVDSEVVERFLEFYEERRQEISGVSIDEELTRMIESQRAFQAASRMINTIDEMLDRVINRMGLAGRA